MPTADANGIELYYETFGKPTDPPLLLVCGLGMQLVGWSQEWIDRMVAEGFFVIAYDNRDVGLSTHLSDAGVPDLLSLLSGDASGVAYLMGDFANDAAGLLDALGIDAAHVLGVSMGGMISQQFAIDHGARVLTLCSIMSTTGAPGVGQPSDTAVGALLRPAPTTREEALDQAVDTWSIIGSPGFPLDEERERALAGAAWDRSHDPDGVARQLGAILGSPDRTPGLAGVTAPTLVIHGADDPLVGVTGGEATAAAIPGATLRIYPGMGHSLPVELWDELVPEIVANTRASGS